MEATETSIIALPDIDTSQNQDPTLDVTISDTIDGSGSVIHTIADDYVTIYNTCVTFDDTGVTIDATGVTIDAPGVTIMVLV